MIARIRSGCQRGPIVSALALLVAAFLPGTPAAGREKKNEKPAESITTGQRVFTCGHSFHVWVPGIVTDLCKKANIPDHVQIGISSIGGSRTIQHWDIPEGKNKAKEALRTGNVDVLTLSPIFLPDAGIENFTRLALEHNKDIRIVVQPIWLRWDVYEPTTKRPAKVDHNAITGEELRKRHDVYFKSMDKHVRALNKNLGKTVLFVVPAPQAVITLREKIIAGQAPGLKTQEDLFTDEPRKAAAASAGRLLQLRRDLPPQSGGIARAQRSEAGEAREPRGASEPVAARIGVGRGHPAPAQRCSAGCPAIEARATRPCRDGWHVTGRSVGQQEGEKLSRETAEALRESLRLAALH
jgi:hypothetical protein